MVMSSFAGTDLNATDLDFDFKLSVSTLHQPTAAQPIEVGPNATGQGTVAVIRYFLLV